MKKFLLFLFFVVLAISLKAQNNSDLQSQVENIVNKKYLLKKDFPVADSLLNLMENTIGINNELYMSLAEKCALKSSYITTPKDKVLQYYQKAETSMEANSLGKSSRIATLLLKKINALNYYAVKDTAYKAVVLQTYGKWWAIHKEITPNAKDIDIKNLCNYHSRAYLNHDNELSISLQKEIVDIYSKTKPLNDSVYQATLCSYTWNLLYDKKDTTQAYNLCNDNVLKLKETNDTINGVYYRALSSLINCLAYDDNNRKIPLMTAKLNIAEQLYGKSSNEYNLTNMSLSIDLQGQGRTRQAIAVTKQNTSKDINNLSQTGLYNYLYGNYSEAISYLTEYLDSLAMKLDNGSKESYEYMLNQLNFQSTCSTIISCYSAISQKNKIIIFLEEIVNKYGNKDKTMCLNICLSSFVHLSSADGKYVKPAFQLLDKINIEDSQRFTVERSKVLLLTNCQKYDEAINILKNVKTNVKSDSMLLNVDKVIAGFLCGKYDFVKDDIPQLTNAIKEMPNYTSIAEYRALEMIGAMVGLETRDTVFAKKCLDNIKSCLKSSNETTYLKEFSLTDVNTLSVFTMVFSNLGDNYDAAMIDFYSFNNASLPEKDVFKRYYENQTKAILQSYNFSSALTNSNISSISVDFLERTLRYANTCLDNSMNAYDAALMCKQLSLNVENSVIREIVNSKDEEVKKAYEKLLKLRQMGTADEQAKGEITQLETQLKNEAIISGDYGQSYRRTWQDVASALHQGECAIEIAKFSDFSNDDSYCAIILNGSNGKPFILPLFKQSEIEALPKEKRQYSSELSDLIWGKISKKVNDVNTIYISPYGIMHNMALESLPNMDKYLPNVKNVFRVSSTLAVLNRKQNGLGNAFIIGGVDYDGETGEATSTTVKPELSKTRGIANGLLYLPGTESEAGEIAQIINKSKLSKATILTGNDASEGAIKKLSGKGVNILHIATHGFYTPDLELESKDQRQKLFTLQKNEDKSLRRCGLFMAGANSALSGENISELKEDGILTAQEISGIDFTGLDLVVLSACESAMGDISGDGVYGLQRAFKKARANSILMSLWSVDDEATLLLMKSFYENLFSGKSKVESFTKAKSAVRQVYPDYHYWAAFILLDAIN